LEAAADTLEDFKRLPIYRMSLSRALSWKRFRAYHRTNKSGELVLVEAITRGACALWGPKARC
jgi:hypothetical protein